MRVKLGPHPDNGFIPADSPITDRAVAGLDVIAGEVTNWAPPACLLLKPPAERFNDHLKLVSLTLMELLGS
jgi:hypothetical protein